MVRSVTFRKSATCLMVRISPSLGLVVIGMVLFAEGDSIVQNFQTITDEKLGWGGFPWDRELLT